jgi:8-oxo-dGTP pyrophosphatase MutT (NUDIX family)
MPYKQGKIRVLALAIVRQGDRIFMSVGYDPVKQQTFYRALGGGVDFGELSQDALKREFQEELNAEITNIRYLGCLESVFIYQGKSGHEVIQLYECDFVDPKFYQLEKVDFNEGERQKTAVWIDLKKCQSGELRVVPEAFIRYL